MNNYMNAKNYSPRSIESYVREMRLLFSHYNDLPPKSITQNDNVNYINFIKIEHGVSRDKCLMKAQSCSFFTRIVIALKKYGDYTEVVYNCRIKYSLKTNSALYQIDFQMRHLTSKLVLVTFPPMEKLVGQHLY